MNSPWAIRDLKHGKTYHFSSFDELVAWVLKNSQPELPLTK